MFNPLKIISKIASIVADPISGNASSTRVGAVSFAGAAITYAMTKTDADPWILGILVIGAVLSWFLRVPSNSAGEGND
jgi:hypothetical protein